MVKRDHAPSNPDYVEAWLTVDMVFDPAQTGTAIQMAIMANTVF